MLKVIKHIFKFELTSMYQLGKIISSLQIAASNVISDYTYLKRNESILTLYTYIATKDTFKPGKTFSC